MKNILVVLSGGVDSTTVLHEICASPDYLEVTAIFFNYGQKHLGRELPCAQYQAKFLGVPLIEVDLTFLSQTLSKTSTLISGGGLLPSIGDVLGDPQPSTYVPFRNLMLLSIAASTAEALKCDEIAYGAQKQDQYGYWDATLEFVEAVQKVLDLNRKQQVTLIAPFVDYSKAEVIQRGVELGVDYYMTWSCYAGQESACGKCPTCSERLRAFQILELIDPLIYKEV